MGKKNNRIFASAYHSGNTRDSKLVIEKGVELIDSSYFENNYYIKYVYFPKSLEVVGFSAFSNCQNLLEVQINERLKEIDDLAFSNCSSLKSIRIPGGVKKIGSYAFGGCTSLSEITLDEGVEIISNSSFFNCKLEEITLPRTLKELDSKAFIDCKFLKKIIVPIKTFFDLQLYNNPTFVQNNVVFDIKCSPSEFQKYYDNDKYKKIFVNLLQENRLSLPNLSTMRKEFSKRDPIEPVLDRSKVLKSILNNSYDIPEGVKEISPNTFKDFKDLKSVTIPNSVNVICAGAFQNCKNLKEVKIADGVKEIRNNVFDGCTSLERIEMPSSVKKIGSFCFNNCTNLRDVRLNEGLEEMDSNVFYGCTSLKQLTIPGSLKRVRGDWFLRSTGLQEVTLKYGITTIEDNAFYMCRNLRKISFPIFFETIGKNAFAECRLLEIAELPNSVKKIGEYAFLNCENITEIKLPSSLYELELNSFRGTNITELVIPSSLKLIKNSLIEGIKLKKLKENYDNYIIDIKNLEKIIVHYDNFAELLKFVDKNCEVLSAFYYSKGKKKIDFVGCELNNIDKLQLFLLLNKDAFNIVTPELDKPIIFEEQEEVDIYTGNKEIDSLVTRIKKEIESFAPVSRDIVNKKVDDELKNYEWIKNSPTIMSYLHGDSDYYISPTVTINTIMIGLNKILKSLSKIEKYNKILERINYYQILIKDRQFIALENDFISEDIINIMKSLAQFPEKYQVTNKNKIKKILDDFIENYIKPDINSLIEGDPLIDDDMDYRANLAILIGNMNEKVSNDLAALKQYQLLLDALKGYKLTVSNELIDNINLLKEKIVSLPEGEFKSSIQNKFDTVINEKIELIINIIQNNESYSEQKYNKLEQDISKQMKFISSGINDYNRKKRLELSDDIFAFGDYYTVSEIGHTSISITGNKKINDLITKIYQQSNFLPLNFKEIINNKVKILLKEFEQARVEFEPHLTDEIKPELHFSNPKMVQDKVVCDLEALLFDLNGVEQFNGKLKQAQYYFDLLNGKETKPVENDFVSEDIIKIIGLLEKFPRKYQNNIMAELTKILYTYKENVDKDIYTLFDDNPFTNPGENDYRSDLSNQTISLSSKVYKEFRVYNKLLLLQSALMQLKTTSDDENINNILAFNNLIENIEDEDYRDYIKNEFEQKISEELKSIANIIDNGEDYSEQKYREIIMEILSEILVLENKIIEYKESKPIERAMEVVKSNLMKSNVIAVKKELLECLNYIMIGSRVNVAYEHTSIKGIVFDFFNSVVDNDILNDEEKKFVGGSLINAINQQLIMIENGECTPDNTYKIDVLFNEIFELEQKLTLYINKKVAYNDVFSTDKIVF